MANQPSLVRRRFIPTLKLGYALHVLEDGLFSPKVDKMPISIVPTAINEILACKISQYDRDEGEQSTKRCDNIFVKYKHCWRYS
jgi:hypothetical protein